MADSSSSEREAARARLRNEIRRKRERRSGGEVPAPAAAPPAPALSDFAQDPETKAMLSRRVSEELAQIFGTDPATLEVAKEFVDDPLSALLNVGAGGEAGEKCSEEVQRMMAELKQVCDADDEAPPPT